MATKSGGFKETGRKECKKERENKKKRKKKKATIPAEEIGIPTRSTNRTEGGRSDGGG